MGKKLYVGNLPFTTGDAELQTLFAAAGTVESAKAVRDGQTGQPRGFGFVEMSSDDEAQKAITMFHDHELGGRKLAVNEARPKNDFAGAGSGGGNNRGREPRW